MRFPERARATLADEDVPVVNGVDVVRYLVRIGDRASSSRLPKSMDLRWIARPVGAARFVAPRP